MPITSLDETISIASTSYEKIESPCLSETNSNIINIEENSESLIHNFENDSDSSIKSAFLENSNQSNIHQADEYIKISENENEIETESYISEPNTSNDIEGRRIFDVKFLVEQLKNYGRHEKFECSSENMVFVKEVRKGFRTSLMFKCSMCSKIDTLESEREFNEEAMPINNAMVFGNLCTGQSFSQMEERCAVLNMPTMSSRTYFNVQKSVHDKIRDTAIEEIDNAIEIEKKIAIEKGNVDKDGTPLLTVVVDGSWAKRSYKCNYSSLSGVGCIIGFYSEKLLFVGIRNTFCLICCKYQKMEEDIPNHICYKNWSSTANSMEADIIVEGFKQSFSMHGVKYAYMIGDGDSSVYDKLKSIRPYGIDLLVKKIECTNHICRNFNNRIKELSKNRTYNREIVPVATRKILEKNLERLRISLHCIIKKRAIEFLNTKNLIAVKNEIVLDLQNLLNHTFGFHDNCSNRQFKCNGKDDKNYVTELKLNGLWEGLQNAVRLVINHADSLLYNVNNNLAERYNSVVAKFIGGKRCNFVMRDSYEVRCKAAAASFNDREKFLSSVTKKTIEQSPSGKYLQKYNTNIIKKRKLLKCKRRLNVDNRRFSKRQRVTGSDHNYGVSDIELNLPDMSSETYQLRADEFLEKLALSKKNILELERNSCGQSNNSIWISERLKRLTASNFGRICKLRDKTPREKTVISLLYKSFSSSATKWGHQQEPVALQKIRENYPNYQISECGFFVHHSLPYLGASPDALINDIGIVEIKCPFAAKEFKTVLEATTARKIPQCKVLSNRVTLKKNSNYYYQIQGQLEVTNKEFCLFCIWIPNDFVIEKIDRDKDFWKEAMEDKLKNFYFNHLLPEIIDSRYNRNQKLR